MIAEVEAGNVSAVIVKDMSRFGRDYLKVGFYTEVMFKEKGVRFIAINNGIDSANQQDSDFTPFLNIMNVRYIGLFSAVELVKNKGTKEPLVPYGKDPEGVMGKIIGLLRDGGFATYSHENMILVAPPLIITEEQLREEMAVMDQVLSVADREYL